LPDVEPQKVSSWEDLPDVPTKPPPGKKAIPVKNVPTGTGNIKDALVSPEKATDATDQVLGGLAGATQSASLGFGDELSGAFGAGGHLVGKGIEAIKNWAGTKKDASEPVAADYRPSSRDLVEAYRRSRDEARKVDEAAQARTPEAYLGGELLGAFANPLPGPGKGAGLAKIGRMALQGAGIGGLAGLGNSKADLTKGEFGNAAIDTGISGGLGAFLGAGSQAAANGVEKLSGRFTGMKNKAFSDAVTQSQRAQEKAEQSALAKYRSEVQNASRDLEVLSRESSSLPEGEVRSKIAQYLDSPEAMRLREMVAGNKLESAPQRISQMDALKKMQHDLVAAREPNVTAGTEKLLGNPIKTVVLPKAKHLLNRAAGPVASSAVSTAVGGAIGNAFDDEGYTGKAVGSGVGALSGIGFNYFFGNPGTVAVNMIKAPGVRHFIGRWGEKMASLKPVLEKAAANGPLALEAAKREIAGADPEAAKMLSEAKRVEDEADPLKSHFGG
jgi:hypothetical protein